jgi:integrase
MDKKNFVYTLRVFDYDLSKRWYYEANIDGRRIKKYGTINKFTSIKERLAAADQLRQKLVDTPVVRVLRTETMEYIENNKLRWRPKSFMTLKSKAVVFCNWLAGRALTASAMNDFLVHLIASGRSRTTRNGYLVTLKMFNTECWHIPHLFELSKRVRQEPTPARYFTRSQIDYLRPKFAETAPQLLFFVQFMYYTFIRPGELRFLRIEDIILEQLRVRIPAPISKNRKEQYVAIPSAFLPVLQKEISGLPPTHYIFGGIKPYGTNYFSRIHQQIIKKLRFDTTAYKLYSWKHAGAVAAVMSGVSHKELQLQMRHHSLDELDGYLRQLGVADMQNLQDKFPAF